MQRLDDGVKCEPMENLTVNVPDDCVGTVDWIQKLGLRKGEMTKMELYRQDMQKLNFNIPARGLVDTEQFMTDTWWRNNGISI